MFTHIKAVMKQAPVFGPYLFRVYRKLHRFNTSGAYWELRYRTGGNSGPGSYGRLAHFKADTLNGFVDQHKIASVIEWGSGDGSQLQLANYPAYTGVDVSKTAV